MRSRLDLKLCGRTLLGAKPPKGQEMDDHYCGRIRLRVADFMQAAGRTRCGSWASPPKPSTTRWLPPSTSWPRFLTRANIACDHNQLTMEVMRIVAKQNGLACLLHEKPFAGVNGSGKHNNWSLSTDDGHEPAGPRQDSL